MALSEAYSGRVHPPPLATPETASPPCAQGWEVFRHASLASTNIEARHVVAAGFTRKTIIVADAQTNGQCRHDRLWESKPGMGLWASFILPVSLPFDLLPQSTLVLAVAVREGILDATSVALEAKWPNDLLGNGRKCCGLLVETGESRDSSGPTPLILGVGINLDHGAEDFPPYLRGTATSLRLLADGRKFDRGNILHAVAASIHRWFSIWETQGFSRVRDAWLAGNCTMGKRIILSDGYGYPHATAKDLDETGALLAQADDGTALLVDSGEIGFTTDMAAMYQRR